ncbi:unnamed protein product [Ostreobium quekettii]|uniref:Uncharacterized protein n=1 Tax=Ostreobium quekettii TaxID=121088 RepID=A0A8S1IXP0_9CHLO|nr:unnamed protein product [Ostreobium quekettii]|eukprot:evm.model.scf_13EXC.23 EVM.evm.TU.scf_13EXC.23   scf_13EXC:256659-259237(-)
MRAMSLTGTILAVLLLTDGLCAEGFHRSRHLTQDCTDVPSSDQCIPGEDVSVDAVKKAKDKDLADLWLSNRECLKQTEEDDCGDTDGCVWQEMSCTCQLKELVDNQSLCLGLPDPAALQAAVNCPTKTSEDDCLADDLCKWESGVVCLAKDAGAPPEPVPEDEKPMVCRLLKVADCSSGTDQKSCEKTKGKCEWVAFDVDEVPEPTCPAIIEQLKGLPPPPPVEGPIESCSPTASGTLEAIFDDKKVWKPVRDAEKDCKGSC